jgi:hypothetical protein
MRRNIAHQKRKKEEERTDKMNIECAREKKTTKT